MSELRIDNRNRLVYKICLQNTQTCNIIFIFNQAVSRNYVESNLINEILIFFFSTV